MPLSLQHYTDAGEVALFFPRYCWSKREIEAHTGVHGKAPRPHPVEPTLFAAATQGEQHWVAVIYRPQD